MKTALYAFLLWGNLAFAANLPAVKSTSGGRTDITHEIEIAANLSMIKCSELGGQKYCMSGVPFGSTKISLTAVCDENDGGEPGSPGFGCESDPTQPDNKPEYHTWRGHYSAVADDRNDGIRYIGIVTVEKYFQGLDDAGQEQYYYSFQVEILGKRGAVAEMSLGVSDLNKMQASTLMGPEVELGGNTYQPYFSIGGPILDPCDPSEGCDPEKKKNVSKSPNVKTKWNVKLGYLK